MDTFDFIVVGAGSAGCALAARLSESGQHSVALLEAGSDDPWIWLRIPTGVAKIMVGSRALWRFQTEPEAGLNGRDLFCPRGKVLGGTSMVNGMFWVHGDPAEYDHWRDSLGLTQWGYREVLPYFKKMECYTPGDPAARGRDGPLVITQASPRDRLSDAFLKACAEAGYPETQDYNDGSYAGGGLMQFSTRRGLRWSVREAYVRPALKRVNLTLIKKAQVTRILFDGKQATGIEYRQDGVDKSLHARAAVVLSAGTIQSPQLLELSGIGDGARLNQLGIKVVHHSP